MSITYAEDTEIYKNLEPPANSNILFILDLSGSMRWNVAGEEVPSTSPSSRLNIMKQALAQVLNDPEIKNINMGLMGFSGIANTKGKAHGPTFPVTDIDYPSDLALAFNPTFNPAIENSALSLAVGTQRVSLESKLPWLASKRDAWLAKALGITLTKTLTSPDPAKATTEEISTREYIQLAANTWSPGGSTPIVDSLYEATLYFKGLDVDYGRYLPNHFYSAHPSSYTGELTLQTTTPHTVCSRKACYGTDCDASTKQCTPYPAGTDSKNCDVGESLASCQANHPTWVDCYSYTGQNCSETCPAEKYDENNNCLNPSTSCTDETYYVCQEPYTSGEDCTHEVCSSVTNTILSGTPKYISPIKDECQNSSYILLSDGQPTENFSANKVNALIPASYSNACHTKGNSDPTAQDITFFGRCGLELAKYLHSEDQSSTLDGKQTIETSTIGFALGNNSDASNYLTALAKNGGGEFYSANNLVSLAESFKSALLDATKRARLFTTPSFTVNPSHLQEHSNEVYLPVFSYSNRRPRWSGNLKKFKLVNNVLSDNANIAATDANGVLRADAKDEWATTIPNHAIKEGGAASKLNPATRTLLTDISGSLETINSTNVSKALLGDASMTDTTQDALLNFIQGYEKDGTTARKHMGDIVHSKPVIITYGTQKRIFVGTNEGFLHSFDENGIEKFAFMPQTLLKNIAVQYRNNGAEQHVWGVDGEITTWLKDTNHNGQWDTDEKVYLFFGLRRGGNSYYALDVSDPNANPTLLWTINPSRSGFSQLGQTWSTPVLTQLRYGGSATLKPVLIFGGGYNTRIDEQDTTLRSGASTSNAGTTVYIVNALTGDKIWSASHIEMKYAIPGNIRALDMDRNGSVDRLYFGDMGGNIWRADLNAGNFLATPSLHDLSQTKIVKLAELGANDGTDLRKFFYEPDVAFFRYKGRFLLTVAIGSGYRSHPLNNNVVDRFFVLRDQYVLKVPDSSFHTITEGDLVAAPITNPTKNLLATDYYGWYRTLTATTAEKVLATAVTFMNRVSFTTFGKTTGNTGNGSCDVVTNFQSRAYVLDLLKGGAVIDFDSGTSGNEPSIPISKDEIVSTPQIIFSQLSPCTKTNCHQGITMRIGKNSEPFVDNTTPGGNVDITNLLPKVYWLDMEK